MVLMIPSVRGMLAHYQASPKRSHQIPKLFHVQPLLHLEAPLQLKQVLQLKQLLEGKLMIHVQVSPKE